MSCIGSGRCNAPGRVPLSRSSPAGLDGMPSWRGDSLKPSKSGACIRMSVASPNRRESWWDASSRRSEVMTLASIWRKNTASQGEGGWIEESACASAGAVLCCSRSSSSASKRSTGTSTMQVIAVDVPGHGRLRVRPALRATPTKLQLPDDPAGCPLDHRAHFPARHRPARQQDAALRPAQTRRHLQVRAT